MPHQCVRCGKMYDDGAKELLSGCTECKGKLFFFISKERYKRQFEEKEEKIELTLKDRKQIEKDIDDILGLRKKDDKPIILDLESINLSKPGQYEIDLVHLFKKDPIVFKLEEGKYMLDLKSLFEQNKKK